MDMYGHTCEVISSTDLLMEIQDKINSQHNLTSNVYMFRPKHI